LAKRIKLADPARLVDSASGWTDLKAGDVIDLHSYPDPLAPTPETTRAGVLGEFGGLGLGISHHTWMDRKPWGYQILTNSEQLTENYGVLLNKVWTLHQGSGLAAAVYTQLTDVEAECNGFMTYDREVVKMDVERVLRANWQDAMLLPNAQRGRYMWSYTIDPPATNWMQPGFVASDWKTGVGGFGTKQAPQVIVNTTWSGSDIWLRREFQLPQKFTLPTNLIMYHDEDVEVYLNGVLATHETGYVVGYKPYGIAEEAARALHPGNNVIAVHCHQSTGGQFIDVGIAAEPPPPNP
jgi:hypothetical protein